MLKNINYKNFLKYDKNELDMGEIEMNIDKKLSKIQNWCNAVECRYCPLKGLHTCCNYCQSRVKPNPIEVINDYNTICSSVDKFGLADYKIDIIANMTDSEKEAYIANYCGLQESCSNCKLNNEKCLHHLFFDLDNFLEKLLNTDKNVLKELTHGVMKNALKEFCRTQRDCFYCPFVKYKDGSNCNVIEEKEQIKRTFNLLCMENDEFRKKWTIKN